MLKLCLLFILHSNLVIGSQYYDSFHGTPISNQELKRREKANTTFYCTTEVRPCNPFEYRRIDGTCNNLEHPTRGASHTPMFRSLPPLYDTSNAGFEPRLSENGDRMPLARRLRTGLLAEGSVPDQKFTQLLVNYLVFITGDVATAHDTINYVLWTPYCCDEKGKSDPMCTPNEIPADDPVHRFSGQRCLNMTRPMSFQSSRCLRNDTAPERINSATPLFDLSPVYGNSNKLTLEKGRLFRGGLLKYEMDDRDRMWPPSTKTKVNVCRLNEKPFETRCHDTPEDGLNTLFGVNLIGIYFWREHNRIANKLSTINPCWDDDKLFYVARDINIAKYLQMFYYELLPRFMGHENLIKDDVISAKSSFRDVYKKNIIPQTSLEFLTAMRWVHTIQDGTLKLYEVDGTEVGEYPVVNLTLRTGYLARDRNIELVTQSQFRQPAASIDYVVDPLISELALGPHQRTSDVTTNDVSKNRYFGFAPYVDYLNYCRGKSYEKFEDLLDVIDPERVERLRELYEDIRDIDLQAGIWSEKYVMDGHVPRTFYCLVVDQLKRNTISDRHWYEREQRPGAFTQDQLREIRKASVSRLLCDVGDSVTQIQPRSFERIGPGNELRDCEELNFTNLNAWKDSKCVDDDRGRKPLNKMRG